MVNRPENQFTAPQTDEGWEQFFSEHDELIRKVVAWRKWSFTPEVQEDVAQSIRMGLVKALPRFKGDSSLAYFIKRIAMNKCLDELRKTIRNKGRFTDLDTKRSEEGGEAERGIERVEGDSPAPFESMLREERIKLTRGVLTRLDDTCQVAIDAYYVRGQSYKEMAEELGLAVNTVGSRLSKCLGKLGKMLEENPVFEEYFLNLRDC